MSLVSGWINPFIFTTTGIIGTVPIGTLTTYATTCVVPWTYTGYTSTKAIQIWLYTTSWVNLASSTCGAGTYTISGLSAGSNYQVAIVAPSDATYASYNANTTISTSFTTATASIGTITPYIYGCSFTASYSGSYSTSSSITLYTSVTSSTSGFGSAITGYTLGTLSTILGLISNTTYWLKMVVNVDSYIAPVVSFTTLVGTPVEYPPSAITGNTTNISASYGSGTYVVTNSTNYGVAGFEAFKAFDKALNSNESWTCTQNNYNTSGAYIGTASLGGYSGEWISLLFPTAISLTSYSLTSFYYTTGDYYLSTPSSWAILGSNDGTTWALVDQRIGISYTGYSQLKTFTLASPSLPYTRYTFVVRANQGNAFIGLTQIGEIRYFGY